MKKHRSVGFKLVALILCVAATVFGFAGCADNGAPEHSVSAPQYTVPTENFERTLAEFISGREDRTSFTQKERLAAEYLNGKLLSYGYTDVAMQEFAAEEGDTNGLTSQNVVAKLKSASGGSGAKNVIIGAYYDNRFSAPYKGGYADGAEAALNGGTGVATLLCIAEYLAENKERLALDYDVTIVFFGASYYTAAGARAFYDKMNGDEVSNTVLMVELQRLGVDHVYAFSDMRETKREGFFDSIAADNSLDIYKITQKTPLITATSALEGIPFYQWAHNGVFGVFFNNNVPTLNLIGANWETLNLNDTESKNNDNLSFTENDKLDVLKRIYPDYARKMAAAATLVIDSLADDDFLSVMEYDRKNFPETDILTKQWIWYVIVAGIMAIAAGVMLLICSHLGKKYPHVVNRPRKMKMAVFGMDYEDKNSADIFIDVKNDGNPFEEIFPGVDNNARRSSDPADEIFPPLFPPLVDRGFSSPEEKNTDENPQDPFDVKGDTDTKVAEPSDDDHKVQDRDPFAPNKKPEVKKTAVKKRKTPSAGEKSATEKKDKNKDDGTEKKL